MTDKKTRIYVFGNIWLKKDSRPIRLLPKLKEKFPDLEFDVSDPNENFPPKEENELIILDTVLGLKKEMILDIGNLSDRDGTPVSPHDYDLMFHLKLLQKTGRLKKAIILGIKENSTEESIVRLIEQFLQTK